MKLFHLCIQRFLVLVVGNSFSTDTMEHAANIALALGIPKLHFGTLYLGGCSIGMHYAHAIENLPAYVYYTNDGNGWEETPDYRIEDAVKSADWDWIVIQHGTHGESRYTSVESYEKLTPLIQYIKERAPAHTKIAFNLTWMGESTRQHHEILSYGGDIAAMRAKLEEVTKQVILTNPLVDRLIPTGTAIENARTSQIGLLTRDCYHLSMDKGRYIAALTFLACITERCIDAIDWAPQGVDPYAKAVAIESANNAIRAPLCITPSALTK